MIFDYSKHQRYLIQNQLNPNYNHTIGQLGTSLIYKVKMFVILIKTINLITFLLGKTQRYVF